MVKRVGKYELGRTLGKGTFGKVKYAIDTSTNSPVAIKIMDKSDIQSQNMGSQIKKEISVMKMIKHESIVNLIEVLASKTKVFMVLELVTGGELFDKIVTQGKFDERTARFYFHQLLSAVDYCHSQGVCHRDLKPENLLLDSESNLKISDFGLSALFESHVNPDSPANANLLHTTCGTPNYVAPEVLLNKGYDGKLADVWSMGVILYVFRAGFLPFDEQTMAALFRKIVKAEFVYPKWFSSGLIGLLDKMLVAEPSQRSNLDAIKNDAWVQSTDVIRRSSSTTQPALVQVAPILKVDEWLEQDDEKGANHTGPITMNAFDLISMVGGAAINRMFQKPEEQRIKSYTQFSSKKTTTEIMDRVSAVLTAMGNRFKVYDKSCKIKLSISSPKGPVFATVQIFVMTPILNVVECRRTRGNMFAYHSWFKEFHTSLADIESAPEKPHHRKCNSTSAIAPAQHS